MKDGKIKLLGDSGWFRLTEETPRRSYGGGGNIEEENNVINSDKNNITNGHPPQSSSCNCQSYRASCPSPTCRRKAGALRDGDNNPYNAPPHGRSMSITVHGESYKLLCGLYR